MRRSLDLTEYSARVALQDVNRELEAIARRDPLTQLLNRQTVDEKLDELLALNKRHGFSATALLIDLDNFKAVNDILGHETGDKLLVAVAKALTRGTRDTDLAYRLGGDEFLILLQNQTSAGARIVAERLERAVEALCSAPELGSLRVGASSGVLQISHEPGRCETAAQVLEAVDEQLYVEKRARRMAC